jgi:ABC-type nitrate/sulfonate/bicarbonate transport system permease component
MSRRNDVLAKAIGLACFAAVWELANATAGAYWVPGIEQVTARISKELAAGRLIADIASTAQLLLAGLAIGTVLGTGLASLLRLSPRVDAMIQPFVTAVMSIPKLGLVPLLVLWFGTGLAPKIMLVTLTVLFIVFSLAYSGLVTVDARLAMTARVFGASPLQLTRHVVLPSVLPFVFTGIQVALPWAVSAALVAEYLSAKVGIGHAIEQARQLSDSVGVYYGIVMATVLVLMCNAVLSLLRTVTLKHQAPGETR